MRMLEGFKVLTSVMLVSCFFVNGCGRQVEKSGAEPKETAPVDVDRERAGSADAGSQEASGDGLQAALEHIRNDETSRAVEELMMIEWEGLDAGTRVLDISESEFKSLSEQERTVLRREALALDRDLRQLGRAGLNAAERKEGEARRKLLESVRSLGQYLQDDKLAVFGLTGQALSNEAEQRLE